ncbi:EamA/RhaT family transporter [Alteromonas sp. MB-3u-76]|uniref:DMT family transporter n=1 Tax=unclassified Alteromonas TaxID=2614992 RepID=UPI00090352D7|nr:MULTISPECIES: DMT family transporter [unclassified Alteromonas]APE05289.1 EamA family transporter [Alteromonas sp. RW2A1]AUC88333.1 EamA/RhaT family transporter [Alteromonas sp. MB-3u-76]
MLKATLLVVTAMIAFAANSLLCRMALVNTDIDPSSFTIIRLLSGAFSLLVLTKVTQLSQLQTSRDSSLAKNVKQQGSVAAGLALFVYALGFSYAYIAMSTGTGALLLFGTVQITMIATGLYKGERFAPVQWLGFTLAITGLILLLLPSSSAPSMTSSVLMVLAGIGWGAYSLLGKSSTSPLLSSAGNFVYASILCIPLVAVILFAEFPLKIDMVGGVFAVASGALASGAGYAIWYTALPLIKSTTAATVQLSVPVIAAFMGWALLDESLSWTILVASAITLGGIFLVVRQR